MNGKIKAILAAVVISTIVVSLALYQPTSAAYFEGKAGGNRGTMDNPRGDLQRNLRFRRHPMLWLRLLRNGEPVTVEGTIVNFTRHMLILDTGEGQIRVIVPSLWSTEEETITIHEAFDEGILSPGDSVTVNALRWDIREEELTVYALFGYEISYDEGTLYAVLPINIEG